MRQVQKEAIAETGVCVEDRRATSWESSSGVESPGNLWAGRDLVAAAAAAAAGRRLGW